MSMSLYYEQLHILDGDKTNKFTSIKGSNDFCFNVGKSLCDFGIDFFHEADPPTPDLLEKSIHILFRKHSLE
jgi:hypothetical protein